MEPSSEKTVWQFFVRGDLNAFSTLFKYYYPNLYDYGLRITNDPVITEDCLQDFFVYLFEHKDGMEDVDRIRPYLFVSFKRALFKKLRRLPKTRPVEESDTVFIFSQEEIRIGEEMSALRARMLETTLNSLTPREREVIYLKYYSNLGYAEIQEVMAISYQSVLNTLQKAFSKLRNRMETAVIQNIMEK